MTNNSSTEAPLPPRVTWFAPWRWFSHWRPWKRWTLFVGVALVTYALAPVPLYLALGAAGLRHIEPFDIIAEVFFFPIEMASQNCVLVQSFYTSLRDGLEALLRMAE